MCGEHSGTGKTTIAKHGSSPRVRGTPEVIIEICATTRFIPACAGNTTRRKARVLAISVHPRVCGEHGNVILQYFVKFRFIPACAGNTAKTKTKLLTCSVHPRVCGEHIGCTLYIINRYGSSPRVRGTHLTRCINSITNRFIPACAGNT